MLSLKGDESPQEVIALSYGLEAGLQKFYSACASMAIEGEVVRMVTKLAEIEVKHKDRLFALYLEVESSPLQRDAFEAQINTEMIEGGFNPDELLQRNLPNFKSGPDVLNFAMMLEAQAMDLYMRYADKCEDPKVKKILFKMADEEKAHLTSLGGLLDRQ